MKCDLCEAKATVFFTNIIGGKMKKVSLCESCAEDRKVTEATGYDLADLLIGVGQEDRVASSEQGSRCQDCGFTHADFKRVGRLGCASCYSTFREELGGILKAMHKDVTHVGKVPTLYLSEKRFREQLAVLDGKLLSAIDSEDFENAANLRDEIQRLRAEADQFSTPTSTPDAP